MMHGQKNSKLNIISRIKVNCEYIGRKGIRTDRGTDLLIPIFSSGWGVIAQFHPPAALIFIKITSVPIALEDGLVPEKF